MSLNDSPSFLPLDSYKSLKYELDSLLIFGYIRKHWHSESAIPTKIRTKILNYFHLKLSVSIEDVRCNLELFFHQRPPMNLLENVGILPRGLSHRQFEHEVGARLSRIDTSFGRLPDTMYWFGHSPDDEDDEDYMAEYDAHCTDEYDEEYNKEYDAFMARYDERQFVSMERSQRDSVVHSLERRLSWRPSMQQIEAMGLVPPQYFENHVFCLYVYTKNKNTFHAQNVCTECSL